MKKEYSSLDDFLEDENLIDEDDLLENVDGDAEEDEDELFEDKPKKKKKTQPKKSKAQPKKPKRDVKKLLITSVIPAIAAFGVGALSTAVLMNSSAQSQSGTTRVNNKIAVTTINEETSLRKRLDTLNSSQLEAILQSMKALTVDNKIPENIGQESVQLNNLVVNAITTILDPLFTAILDEQPVSNEEERYTALSGYFDIDPNSDQTDLNNKIVANLRAFIKHGSLSKTLNLKTAKAGQVFASLIGIDKYNQSYYQVIVPAMSENNDLYNVIYTVKLTTDNKVIAISYNGFIDGNVDAKLYYDSLGAIISGDITNLELSKEQAANDLPQNKGKKKTATENKSEETTSSSSLTSSENTTETTISSENQTEGQPT